MLPHGWVGDVDTQSRQNMSRGGCLFLHLPEKARYCRAWEFKPLTLHRCSHRNSTRLMNVILRHSKPLSHGHSTDDASQRLRSQCRTYTAARLSRYIAGSLWSAGALDGEVGEEPVRITREVSGLPTLEQRLSWQCLELTRATGLGLMSQDEACPRAEGWGYRHLS